MRRSKNENERKKEILHFRTTEEIKSKIYQEVGERMTKLKRPYTTSEFIESVIIDYFSKQVDPAE
jgi:hypothetical protein